MVKGVLIAESLRVGATLESVPLVVQTIRRSAPDNVTPGQPRRWTLLEFEAEEAEADRLATALADVLDEGPPPWYVDFHGLDESFVVFPGRIFRYPRSDAAGRAEAASYGRARGVPESQLDWPD